MNVVIVGGGISGISAAKVVLKEGHYATILEEAPEPAASWPASRTAGWGSMPSSTR